eukprot:GHVT01004677.1.p1 GENE.GHVT01004677.1~~GHVT01004677.1.p1  ORF type:complete len:190 (-),score=37.06 GHVT01004677.1:79-648(-)
MILWAPNNWHSPGGPKEEASVSATQPRENDYCSNFSLDNANESTFTKSERNQNNDETKSATVLNLLKRSSTCAWPSVAASGAEDDQDCATPSSGATPASAPQRQTFSESFADLPSPSAAVVQFPNVSPAGALDRKGFHIRATPPPRFRLTLNSRRSHAHSRGRQPRAHTAKGIETVGNPSGQSQRQLGS